MTAKAVVWHRGGEDFHRTISTVAIKDDVVYAADLSGFLYALDAQSGEHFRTYDAFAAIWGSPFVADGKIYLGDEDGDVAVLREGKKLEVLAEINMGAAVYTTPVAATGSSTCLAATASSPSPKGPSERDPSHAFPPSRESPVPRRILCLLANRKDTGP